LGVAGDWLRYGGGEAELRLLAGEDEATRASLR
jgi:hypothetical protein